MVNRMIGVIGARSLVGTPLLLLLTSQGNRVLALSRSDISQDITNDRIQWLKVDKSSLLNINRSNQVNLTHSNNNPGIISNWISLAPVWVLVEHFSLLKSFGIRRIVALSSTSLFAKENSTDSYEKDVAKRLSEGEEELKAWANANGIQWVILRPTLIYGMGEDQNIREIARIIRRLGFFPLFGKANGLRQPVHAEDVANACFSAMQCKQIANRSYNLSGGETLTYREMIIRMFTQLGLKPRFLPIPLWLFRLSIKGLNLLPRYRGWNSAMAERMNQDLCFEHSEATKDFGFNPRMFEPDL